MFCRDKEATAVISALHSYDYHPALREDRGFPLIPKTCILIFGYCCSGEVSARIVLPFFFKPTDIHSIGFLRFRFTSVH